MIIVQDPLDIKKLIHLYVENLKEFSSKGAVHLKGPQLKLAPRKGCISTFDISEIVNCPSFAFKISREFLVSLRAKRGNLI
jgi:hypothetical protein